MSESNREGSSLGQEDVYKFTTYTALEKALENNGWRNDKVHQFFRSLPKELTDSFPERSMTRAELKEYASKLDAAQTRYEQINLLKQVALKGLREEIGATISFENLGDLEAALQERGITYPKGYLEQTGSSFLSGWGKSRSLTMTSYESMIKVLKASENEEEYIRGQIIAKAFNTPIEQKAVSNDTVKEVYPDKNTAFSQSIKDAKHFPFVVKYSENGKSYELPVSTHKNTIIFGEKTITLTNGQISIQSITVNGDNFIINGKRGLISGTETISKEKFISDILPKFLSNTSSSIDLSGYRFQIGINGTENAREISVSSSVMESATQAENINEKSPEFMNALKMALLSNKSLPFTFSYMENGKEMTSKFDATSDTFFIGNKKYTLQSKDFNFLSISIDPQSVHFGTTQNMPSGEKLTSISKYSKQEFIDGFLPSMLAGKDVVFSGKPLSFKIESSTTTSAVSGVEVNSSPAVPPQSPKTSHEVMKYSLGAYEGYALRHLNRAGKTITDLQNALIAKNIPVNPTGRFDQQTLDAVFAFQKTIPNPIFQPDGLIGSRETIPALFGIASMPNIDRETSRASGREIARNNTDQAIATPVSNQRESRGLSFDEKMSQLSSYFKDNGYTQTSGKLFWRKDGESPFHIFINADKQSISITDAQNKPLTGSYTPEQISVYNHIAEKIGIPKYTPVNVSKDQFFPVGGPQLSGGRENKENNSERMKRIQNAYEGFMSEVKRIDSQDGMLFDSAENIKRHRGEIDTALLNFSQAVAGIDRNTLTEEEKKYFDAKYINIARYFTNTLSGVSNRQYKDYDLAFGFALLLVQNDLQKQNIKIPQKPTEDSILASVSKTNPELHKKLVDGLRSGYTLGQILSNPQVRGQFDEVYEEAYKKYEADFQIVLTRLKNERPNLSSTQGQAALDMMMSIIGTTDWTDIKARNLDMIGKTAGMVGSTAVGILAAAATPFTGGVTAPVSAALIGGAVTTGGMILTSGRGGLDRETFTEAGINIAMFGLGGALLKGTRLIRESGMTLARTTGYSLDAAGGLALGVSADYVRSWEANAKFNLSTSLKYNLPWALLPLLTANLKSKNLEIFKPRAEKLKANMDIATQQAKLGDHAGAAATLKQKVEPEAKALADDVKKTQEKVVDTPHETTPPKENGAQPTKPEAHAHTVSEKEIADIADNIGAGSSHQLKENVKNLPHKNIDDVIPPAEKSKLMSFLGSKGEAVWKDIVNQFSREKNMGPSKMYAWLQTLSGWGGKRGYLGAAVYGATTQGATMLFTPDEFERFRDNDGNINYKNFAEAFLAGALYKAVGGIRASVLQLAYMFYFDKQVAIGAQPPVPEKTPSDTPENRVNTSSSTETLDQPSIIPSQETPSGATI